MEHRIFFAETTTSFLASYPAKGSGINPALIICPGGAYGLLAEHEGKDYAEWLSSLGIHCFVLNYQLGAYPGAVLDLSNAVAFIHANAEKLKVDKQRIGLVGSSAGAHLITTLFNDTTRSMFDVELPKINLSILCYPLISMVTDVHKKSLTNLLSEQKIELAKKLSAEHSVAVDFPPTFMWHTAEDQSVTPSHSLLFARKLSDYKIPFELHIFNTGGHGLGLKTEHPWPDLCENWLKTQNFLTD